MMCYYLNVRFQGQRVKKLIPNLFFYLFFILFYFFLMELQPLVGQCLLIIEALRLHSRHKTLDRTQMDERSAQRRDLYPTTYDTHKRQTSTPPAGFEPAIPTSKQPKTHALYRVSTGIANSES